METILYANSKRDTDSDTATKTNAGLEKILTKHDIIIGSGRSIVPGMAAVQIHEHPVSINLTQISTFSEDKRDSNLFVAASEDTSKLDSLMQDIMKYFGGKGYEHDVYSATYNQQ